MIARVRAPRSGVVAVLECGRLRVEVAGVAVASAFGAGASSRSALEVSVGDIAFGPRSSPLLGTLIDAGGCAIIAAALWLDFFPAP